MTYKNAVLLISAQERNLRKVNGIHFVHGNHEYRLTYFGGFSEYVGIDRREIGRRNYKYFGGVGASRCWTVGQVLDLVRERIGIKETD